MSNQTAEPKTVASKFEELAEALGVDIEDVQVKVQQDFGSKTLDGKAIKEAMDDDATEGGDEEESVTEGDDEQTPTESDDDPEGVDEDDDTLEEGEVQCQCGAVFDSKQGLNGHLAHCDSTEGGDDSEEDEDTSEAGDDQPSKSELLEAGVKESNIEDVLKYRSKNGVCSEEDCPYGANNDSDYCASHQGSKSKSKTSNNSNSSSSKSYDNLTEGQKAAAQDLLTSGEVDSLEEAVEMV